MQSRISGCPSRLRSFARPRRGRIRHACTFERSTSRGNDYNDEYRVIAPLCNAAIPATLECPMTHAYAPPRNPKLRLATVTQQPPQSFDSAHRFPISITSWDLFLFPPPPLPSPPTSPNKPRKFRDSNIVVHPQLSIGSVPGPSISRISIIGTDRSVGCSDTLETRRQ